MPSLESCIQRHSDYESHDGPNVSYRKEQMQHKLLTARFAPDAVSGDKGNGVFMNRTGWNLTATS